MKPFQSNSLRGAALAVAIALLANFFPTDTIVTAVSAVPFFKRLHPTTGESDMVKGLLPLSLLLGPNLPNTSTQNSTQSASQFSAVPYFPGKENGVEFSSFVKLVGNGQRSMIRGVYVPGIFALPITQQPQNNPIFVSNKRGQVTQFRSAARNGVTGLLAHNYLAGSLFYKLVPGQKVLIVNGDGSIQGYQVVSIHRYQKLTPSDLHSNLLDLNTGQEIAPSEVFKRFYRGDHRVTFQTCLERNGRLDWGLLFVVAVPFEI